LDGVDLDFGSGGPIELPTDPFGTPSHPRLAMEAGKEGYVYLLDADNLGGYQQGVGGGDAVVQRLGPRGGVWSRPSAWPGDGGWVYLPTASGNGGSGAGWLDAYKYAVDGNGNPTLAFSGAASDAFGFSSSSPVVTSSGTTSGSAVVWV